MDDHLPSQQEKGKNGEESDECDPLIDPLINQYGGIYSSFFPTKQNKTVR